MPSSKNYVRNLPQEEKTARARGERQGGSDTPDAIRHRDRREATKLGMVKPKDGKDLDHKKPLSKGGSSKKSNWRVETEHDNRSFPRTKYGALKANHPKE